MAFTTRPHTDSWVWRFFILLPRKPWITMTGLRGMAAASWWMRVMSYRRKARQPVRTMARPAATIAAARLGHVRLKNRVDVMTLLAVRPGPAFANIGCPRSGGQ